MLLRYMQNALQYVLLELSTLLRSLTFKINLEKKTSKSQVSFTSQSSKVSLKIHMGTIM